MRAALMVISGAALLFSACASSEPSWCGRSSTPIYKHGKRCATGTPKPYDAEPVYYVDDCSACAESGPVDWGQAQH